MARQGPAHAAAFPPLRAEERWDHARAAGDDEGARSTSPDVRRAADPMFADGHETAFSDQLPFLLAAEARRPPAA